MDEKEKRKEYLFITFVSVSNQADIRGSAEDIVSAPKGPCGRDRLGPNCFVTLETVRHPLLEKRRPEMRLRFAGYLFVGTVFRLPCLKNVFVEPVQNFA